MKLIKKVKIITNVEEATNISAVLALLQTKDDVLC